MVITCTYELNIKKREQPIFQSSLATEDIAFMHTAIITLTYFCINDDCFLSAHFADSQT